MRFKLLTLIDITETKARRGDDAFLQKQQQNYLTTIQTASLRANPIIKNPPSVIEIDISNIGFGQDISGIHKVWSLEFEFEVDVNIEFLIKDFDLVPVINQLTETVELKTIAFLTNGRPDRNTIIQENDK